MQPLCGKIVGGGGDGSFSLYSFHLHSPELGIPIAPKRYVPPGMLGAPEIVKALLQRPTMLARRVHPDYAGSLGDG